MFFEYPNIQTLSFPSCLLDRRFYFLKKIHHVLLGSKNCPFSLARWPCDRSFRDERWPSKAVVVGEIWLSQCHLVWVWMRGWRQNWEKRAGYFFLWKFCWLWLRDYCYWFLLFNYSNVWAFIFFERYGLSWFPLSLSWWWPDVSILRSTSNISKLDLNVSSRGAKRKSVKLWTNLKGLVTHRHTKILYIVEWWIW